MTYQVSIAVNVSTEDEHEAALEGYKQIMLAGTARTVTLSVRDPAGVSRNITLDTDEADDYAGFNRPIGGMG